MATRKHFANRYKREAARFPESCGKSRTELARQPGVRRIQL
jgi:hypothetical protein